MTRISLKIFSVFFGWPTYLFSLTFTGNLKLFEDPDLGGRVTIGDSLLLPNAYQNKEASALTKQDEDVDELFRSVMI